MSGAHHSFSGDSPNLFPVGYTLAVCGYILWIVSATGARFTAAMVIDLSACAWTVSGWQPWLWKLGRSMELGHTTDAEVAPISCAVPGSVQAALRAADLLPDWNVGLQARAGEWVENRHWIFATILPPVAAEVRAVLRFAGLDGPGELYLDGQKIGEFANSFLPFAFEVTGKLGEKAGRKLRVVFFCPPPWLGQIGVTSTIRDWKPRFYYTWDWIPRCVQTGIFGPAELVVGEKDPPPEVRATYLAEEKSGRLDFVHGFPRSASCQIRVLHAGQEVTKLTVPAGDPAPSLRLPGAHAWNPHGHGNQALYEVVFDDGSETMIRRVGFRTIDWQFCEGAPPAADPWLCVVNGQPLFIQGINWTPIRPNFADLRREDYEVRLKLYRELGFNAIRVWGGGFPEYDWLYDLCDELGLLVWQDFFLSSSGLENCPPDDPQVVREAEEIFRHQVARLRHHASLFLWCGGNELQDKPEAGAAEPPRPAGLDHPLLLALSKIIEELDADRRFVPSTSSGPRFSAKAEDFGKGLHWDVHGPWRSDRVGVQPWQNYWLQDDALFRSEMGHPGAQSVELMEAYHGDCHPMDARRENPYWARFGWWFDLGEYMQEATSPSLAGYVEWSQNKQAEILGYAVSQVKARFPRCGGLLLWMGHDCFPCPVNTSLVDFSGHPKPVCRALAKALAAPVGEASAVQGT